MSAQAKILVAGIGNIFMGDDAFGVEVVARLAGRPLGDGVKVVDFGIRGLDLMYALTDGHDAVILVDAAPRGGDAGSLYVIEPEIGPPDPSQPPPVMEGHGMDPLKVLRLAQSLGGHVKRLLLVGCEPSPVADPEEMQMEMSPPVRAAIDRGVELVESLVNRILKGEAQLAGR